MKYSFVFRNHCKASEEMFAVHKHNCRDIGHEKKRGNTVIDVEAESPREAAIAELMDNYGWDRAEAEDNLSYVDIYPCCSSKPPRDVSKRPAQRLKKQTPEEARRAAVRTLKEASPEVYKALDDLIAKRRGK